MTEDNEVLLKQFFSDAAQQQIADEGFTERVMQSLPADAGWSLSSLLSPLSSFKTFNRLWTLFCVAVFIVLFVVLRGWELLAIHFEVLLRTLAVEQFSVNPLMLAVILFGLLFVGVGEVALNER